MNSVTSSIVQGSFSTFEKFYTEIRDARGESCMRESPQGDRIPAFSSSSQFDEKFLQAVWNEQPLPETLLSLSGHRIRVLSKGTWNVEPGPDFSNASIEVDGVVYFGDVEIHRTIEGWFEHNHHKDSAYDRVILHVFWDYAGETHSFPEHIYHVHLKQALHQSLYSLQKDLQLHSYPYARQVQQGPCASILSQLSDETIRKFFRSAGILRFKEKAGKLQERVIAVGPDQALYEALFEALGYKKNREAFLGLAQKLPLEELVEHPSAAYREALFFGTAGLLPDPTRTSLPSSEEKRVRDMWHLWWEIGGEKGQDSFQMRGSRPLNSPFRRLAGGVTLLENWGYEPADYLQKLVSNANSPKECVEMLMREFGFETDKDGLVDFHKRLKSRARLIGENRAGDIIVNSILPLLYAHGSLEGKTSFEETVLQVFLSFSKLQSNRELEKGFQRMFVPPSRAEEVVKSAAVQQGVLAVAKDFCNTAKVACEQCPLSNRDLLEKMVLKE